MKRKRNIKKVPNSFPTYYALFGCQKQSKYHISDKKQNNKKERTKASTRNFVNSHNRSTKFKNKHLYVYQKKKSTKQKNIKEEILK